MGSIVDGRPLPQMMTLHFLLVAPRDSFNAVFSKLQPTVRSGLLSVFANKALLKCNHAHPFMHCLWLLYGTMADLGSCDRGHMAFTA